MLLGFISFHIVLIVCPIDIVAHMSEAMAQMVPMEAIVAKRKSMKAKTSLAPSRKHPRTLRMDTFQQAWVRALAACSPCQ